MKEQKPTLSETPPMTLMCVFCVGLGQFRNQFLNDGLMVTVLTNRAVRLFWIGLILFLN